MATQHPVMRKTRFVCISDTHNASPRGDFRLPKGDVLIHAGDMTNQGSYSELQRTVEWLEAADFELKIVIAGNHDVTLDPGFYAQHALAFHNQDPQDATKCRQLLEASPSILWLKHESVVINLRSPTGPRTEFKVFGSPYSPANGRWAFGYGADESARIWDAIPADADVVITHTPPKSHCDEARGCPALREALLRVRPRIAVCGHVHEGRGAERIRWDNTASDTARGEQGPGRWEDTGRDRRNVSLIDLTTKGGNPIQNHGPRGKTTDAPLTTPRLEAMETCIVNAAIMASSWPHGRGGKKFNKPIAVDIDLPTWEM